VRFRYGDPGHREHGETRVKTADAFGKRLSLIRPNISSQAYVVSDGRYIAITADGELPLAERVA
jgi:hypothetical protein